MRTFASNLPADLSGVELSKRHDLYKAAGVPPRHAERVVVEAGEWGQAKARLLSALGAGAIVVLTGKRGTGKTQLAVTAIKTYCRSGFSARYVKAIEIFLAIREGMSKKSELAAVKPFILPVLLVIDAMEERGETEWEDRMLGYILDMRYDHLLDTILVTNQDRGRFAESLGASVVSRVHEAGDVIECTWASFREKKQLTKEG